MLQNLGVDSLESRMERSPLFLGCVGVIVSLIIRSSLDISFGYSAIRVSLSFYLFDLSIRKT